MTFFRYFISPLIGTFELESNDVRNPTMIKLTNVKNPDMYYIVTKQSYPATTRNVRLSGGYYNSGQDFRKDFLPGFFVF